MERKLRLWRNVPFVIFLFIFAGFGTYLIISSFADSSSSIYVAQSAAGASDGSSCANARAVTFFNTSANWGTNAGQIGPGTTVHLCGTITTNLTAQGSGVSGSPITVVWEPGASLTMLAASCTNGCINVSNRSYITLNGGTNGIIQVTNNGDQLAANSVIRGISATSTNNVTISYLTIQNIYVKHQNTSFSTDGSAILVNNSSNMTIDHNTMSQGGFKSIEDTSSTGTSNLTISDNDLSGNNWAIEIATATSSAQGPVYIFGNHIHDEANWDDPADNNHHNGIFCFTAGDTTYDPHYSGFYVYNNLFNGDPGMHMTGWDTIQSCSDDTTSYAVFNNIFANTNNDPANGDINDEKGIDPTYNNTLVAANGAGLLEYTAYSGAKDIRNNIFWNGAVGEATRSGCGGTPPTGYSCPTYSLSNNIYANSLGGSTTFMCPVTNVQYGWNSSGWTHWLACTGESNSFGPPGSSQTVTNPGLDSNYAPTTGSAALAAGQNLYSTCNGQPNPGLGALCYGYAGPVPSGAGAGPNGQWVTPVARPTTGAWDVGAFQFITNNSSPPATGDLNSDGHVNIVDLSIFLSHWQQSGTGLSEDFNNDNVVNIVDLSILLSHYGT